MQEGYSICLNEWALDKDIKNELSLLLIISSLCAKGYCYATNTYFSELFGVPEQTISRKLKILERKKYITIEYKKKGCQVIARYIRLTKLLTVDYQNCLSSINKNVKENNININKNIIKENNKKKYFENDELNDLFLEYLDLRTKLKCKNTERAIKLLLNELNKYDDGTKTQMINNSIMNSWKSVYPLKEYKQENRDRREAIGNVLKEVYDGTIEFR